MPDEIGEQMPKNPEVPKEESSMEREQRIRKMVEKRPIGGAQEEPKEKAGADIDALVEAKVQVEVGKFKEDVSDLRSRLEVAEAEKEALKERVAALEGVEALKDPLQGILAAVERTAISEQVSVEKFIIPEEEMPKTKEGWGELIREELTTLRDRGESPYSPYLWAERPEVKKIIDSLPRKDWEDISKDEWNELREGLEREVWLVQKEDGLNTQYAQRSNTLDGLKELVEIAPVTGVELDPEKLDALSNLPAAEAPEYLKGIIPEGESMSIQVSRALHFYTKFFGIWAEEVAREVDKSGGIEDQGRTKWLRGDFDKDKRKWESWVGGEVGKLDCQNNARMKTVAQEVIARLGFGSNGKIQYSILKEIFQDIPKEALAEKKYRNLKERIENARDTGGLSLPELFDKNMFSQSVNSSELRYNHWLVSMLAGSEYAGESALRFLRYTGESGEMNTTHTPGTWAADAFTRIPWIERRRLAEARKRRAGGPRVTLGRYRFDIEREGKERGLIHSWLREAEIEINGEKKKIIELLRSNDKWFHEIEWDKLDRGTYVNDFLLPLSHSVAVFKAVTNPNLELVGREGLLSEAGALEALNKSFQYAFDDWEKGRVVLQKEEGTGWEKRERWARTLLGKKLSEINQESWSPWVSFGVGLIYEHHPDQKLPMGVESPTGIKKERKIPHSRRWHKDQQEAESQKLWNPNSVADFLGEGVDQGLFTPSEVRLIKKICNL